MIRKIDEQKKNDFYDCWISCRYDASNHRKGIGKITAEDYTKILIIIEELFGMHKIVEQENQKPVSLCGTKNIKENFIVLLL